MSRTKPLPAESRAALDYIARSQAGVIDDAEVTLGMKLPPETRERLRDLCFRHETTEAARALQAKVKHCPN